MLVLWYLANHSIPNILNQLSVQIYFCMFARALYANKNEHIIIGKCWPGIACYKELRQKVYHISPIIRSSYFKGADTEKSMFYAAYRTWKEFGKFSICHMKEWRTSEHEQIDFIEITCKFELNQHYFALNKVNISRVN